MFFDIENGKRILGISSKTMVHYCEMCHGIWECNCHMCGDDKQMMCVGCHIKYIDNREPPEYTDSPPHLMQNETA